MDWCALCGDPSAMDAQVQRTRPPCPIDDAGPCSLCTELGELERKIASAKEILKTMEVESQRLISRLNDRHAQNIHRLPVEISAEIFQLSRPHNILNEDLSECNKALLCAPLTLAAVCQKWREIAFSTPRLWTSVNIYFSEHNCSLAQLTQEWLLRSGQLPLSINVLLPYSPNPRANAVDPLIAFINQHSRRLKHFRFAGAPSLLSQFSFDPQGVPNIQTLALHPKLSRDFKIIRLGRIHLMPINLKISNLRLEQVCIDWSNLTHLNASDLRLDECFEVLRKTPRLTTCVLGIIQWVNCGWPSPALRHPALQTLKLLRLECKTSSDFLNHLILPSLTSYTSESFYGSDLYNLWSILQRFSCSLEYLSIRSISHPYAASFTRHLRGGANIRHLDLQVAPDSHEMVGITLLRAIFASENIQTRVQHPLPALQSLRLCGCMDMSSVSDALICLANSRLSDWQHLRSIALEVHTSRRYDISEFRHTLDRETVQRILPALESGISITVTVVDVGQNNAIDILHNSIIKHDLGVDLQA